MFNKKDLYDQIKKEQEELIAQIQNKCGEAHIYDFVENKYSTNELKQIIKILNNKEFYNKILNQLCLIDLKNVSEDAKNELVEIMRYLDEHIVLIDEHTNYRLNQTSVYYISSYGCTSAGSYFFHHSMEELINYIIVCNLNKFLGE